MLWTLLGFAFADLPRGKGLCGHARSVKFCLFFPDDNMYTKCLSPCILPPSPCLHFQVFHRRRDEEGHPRRPPELCHMSWLQWGVSKMSVLRLFRILLCFFESAGPRRTQILISEGARLRLFSVAKSRLVSQSFTQLFHESTKIPKDMPDTTEGCPSIWGTIKRWGRNWVSWGVSTFFHPWITQSERNSLQTSTVTFSDRGLFSKEIPSKDEAEQKTERAWCVGAFHGPMLTRIKNAWQAWSLIGQESSWQFLCM